MGWNSSFNTHFQVDPAKTNEVQLDSGTYLTGFSTLWGTAVMQSDGGAGRKGNLEL